MILTDRPSILLTIVAILCLSTLTTSYTLDGQWHLTNSNLNYTSTPSVNFKFTNLIATVAQVPAMDALGGKSTTTSHKGTSQLTV